MNPFWSMSANSTRKKPETEEKTLVGELKTSPPRSAPKKQLPSIPKNVMPINKPASPALSAQSTNGTHASYGPFYLEYSLLAEYTLVVKQKLPGVYVQPSYQSALMWFGVIFIRSGLYEDGVFKFTIYIPDNYPDGECPVSSPCGMNPEYYLNVSLTSLNIHLVSVESTGRILVFVVFFIDGQYPILLFSQRNVKIGLPLAPEKNTSLCVSVLNDTA